MPVGELNLKAEENGLVKVGSALMRVTGIMLGLQLILGGLVTFNLINPEPHVIVGFLLFAVAVATMIFVMLSRPSFRPVQLISVVMVILLILEIVLGFATLNGNNQAIAFAHFLNAIAIFGVSVSGSFIAMRWVQLSGRTPALNAEIGSTQITSGRKKTE